MAYSVKRGQSKQYRSDKHKMPTSVLQILATTKQLQNVKPFEYVSRLGQHVRQWLFVRVGRFLQDKHRQTGKGGYKRKVEVKLSTGFCLTAHLDNISNTLLLHPGLILALSECKV